MILMIDSRTDIPQYYSEWLENRFKAGFLYTRNPAYPLKVQKIILDHEHIDAILFTSKNYEPCLKLIETLNKEYPCIFHYTITGYENDIEPGVPNLNKSCSTLIQLSKLVGKEKVFWRYDPVLLTGKYSIRWHELNFQLLCSKLYGHVNRCIYSYVNLYEKVKRHMPELQDWTDGLKYMVAKSLGKIAYENKIGLQTCNCNLDLTEYGISKSGCVTKELLQSILGLNLKDLKPNGSLGCGFCYPVTNIGEYNTCMNKCKYCYASSDFGLCEKNYAKHNPQSPYLIGNGTPDDEIVEMKPKSVKTNVLTLF